MTLADLKKRALAATPGPWVGDPRIGAIFQTSGKPILTGGSDCDLESRSNVRWIAAANPAAILELIDRYEEVCEALDIISNNIGIELLHQRWVYGSDKDNLETIIRSVTLSFEKMKKAISQFGPDVPLEGK